MLFSLLGVGCLQPTTKSPLDYYICELFYFDYYIYELFYFDYYINQARRFCRLEGNTVYCYFNTKFGTSRSHSLLLWTNVYPSQDVLIFDNMLDR